MTLLDTMADYQRPPIVTNQSPGNLTETVDFDRMKNRIDGYRIRNNICEEASRATQQVQLQESNEKAKHYLEKYEQQKAKKSSKRQRDSSGAASGQQKRKLSTSRNDGPVSKQANTENTVAKEEESNDLEGLDIFDGLDKDLDSCLGVNDIMTILEEAEPVNTPSVPEADDKVDLKLSNGTYHPAPNRLTINNNNPPSQHLQSQPSQQQAAQHVSNTPSPQLQHNGLPSQQVGTPPYNAPTRHPHNPAMYPIKSERGTVVPQSQYNRSMSESASVMAMRQQQQMQQQQLERQASLPGEYRPLPVGTYPAGTKGLHTHMMSRVPQGHLGAEYTKSMSIPSGQPGQYYSPMAANLREYPSVPGYPAYPTSQYPHQGQPMGAEHEMQRMKAMQKAQLARSNSHTGVLPSAYAADPRAVTGYYPVNPEVSAAAAAMQHQASLRANSMLPHSGQPGSMPPGALPAGALPAGAVPAHTQCGMQPRPGYQIPIPNGVATPGLSRQLSNSHHQMPGHEQQNLSKMSTMQHAAAPRPASNAFPMTPQPTMMGAGPTYPVAPMRTMSSTNPAMMSHQSHQTSPLTQQHMPRPGSAGSSQVLPQNHMIPSSHPSSMHPHAIHRPPSGGVLPQSQQMMLQTTSPPHAQSHTLPQQHYSMQQQQQMHPQMSHHNMHLQHPLQQHSQQLLSHPHQHNQTQQVQPTDQPQHPQQYQEDLNDLELILSAT